MAMNYSDKVMEHFTNPQNVGEIENASGCGTVGNAVCGDIMRVYLDIDENNVIQDAKFKTFGCGAAIATSSMATVLVKGKTVQEALKVTNILLKTHQTKEMLFMKKDGFYSSGEFAKMAHITKKTLRYYDAHNILKPSYLTPYGARFYSDEDFARLQQILLLKYLGFSLEIGRAHV